MKTFIAKRVISILVNLRYLRFKLLKYKENNKKICNTFDHNFKNIPYEKGIILYYTMVPVLGQLPMRTIPHQIKLKPNYCPPGPLDP